MSSNGSGSGQNGQHLSEFIRTSAHDIWLAGLGAYSRAGEEGARFFESLVRLGESVERRAREQVARPFRVAEQRVDKARFAASEGWERLSRVVDRRATRLLHALQIPTRRDVAELTERVDELRTAVEALTGVREIDRRPSRAGTARKEAKPKAAKRAKKKRAAASGGRRRTTAGARKTRSTRGGASRS